MSTRDELLFKSETLDGIESLRIAMESRVRSMMQDGIHPQFTEVSQRMVADLADMEKRATKDLERAMKDHPLGPWVKRSVGIGMKQGARLIAAIGPISWNALDDRLRRGPAELWAYCGYVPGQKRKKGVKSNWNANAKSRSFLIAECAIKAGVRKLDGCDDTDGYDVEHREAITPLGVVYLKARRSWADRDVKDGHKHNHALRLVAKEILKDLFLEARELEV